MYNDQFEVRLARVRHRFATTLESKVKDAVVSAESMADSHEGGTKQISDCYRDLHSICGIGPTVGFTATGEAARAAEGTLMQAHHENRGLNETEVISLKIALESLQVAAASELRVMYRRGGSVPAPGLQRRLARNNSSAKPMRDIAPVKPNPGFRRLSDVGHDGIGSRPQLRPRGNHR